VTCKVGNVGEQANVRRYTAVENLVHQDGNIGHGALRSTQRVKADECVRDMVRAAGAVRTDCRRRVRYKGARFKYLYCVARFLVRNMIQFSLKSTLVIILPNPYSQGHREGGTGGTLYRGP